MSDWRDAAERMEEEDERTVAEMRLAEAVEQRTRREVIAEAVAAVEALDIAEWSGLRVEAEIVAVLRRLGGEGEQ